jgi:hypothetical protein
MWDAAKASLNHADTAKRFYMGKVVASEAADSAVKQALGKGGTRAMDAASGAVAAGKRWGVRGVNFAKTTGGYISNEFAKGVIPARAVLFNRPDESVEDAYPRQLAALSQAQGNLQGAQNVLQGHFGPTAEMHPNMTMNHTASVIGAYKYLLEAIPVGAHRGASPLTPQLKAPSPSPGEVTAFKRKWEAAMNPYSVLDDIGNNRLTKEAVQTIQAVYPGFYRELRTRTIENLSQLKAPITYQQKQTMELLLQMPGGLIPANAPGFQQRYAQLSSVVGGGPPPGPGGKPSNGKPGSNKGSPSLAQQIQSPVDQATAGIHN